MRSFGLIASVLGVLIAADAGDDAAKKDLEKFQGNWQLISAEQDGKQMAQEDAKKITLTIQANNFILRKDGEVKRRDSSNMVILQGGEEKIGAGGRLLQ